MTNFEKRALAVVLALTSSCAHAQVGSPTDDLHEISLDIDNDGKMDRAALVRNKASHDFDLYIYLGLGNKKLDLSQTPAVLKRSIATSLVLAFESRGKGSLVIGTGCGGCSNDSSTTLTIVHRGGDFLIAGYTLDWETRYGAGRCDVNFLSGKATLQRDQARARPLKGTFAPIRLADWSEEKRPTGCF